MTDDSSSSDESDSEGVDGVANEAKKVSRIPKKKLSPLIRKDLLGVDGDDAMHNAKKLYEKEKAREQKMIELIQISNGHFENKMKERMKRCLVNKRQSVDRLYKIHGFAWRKDFKAILDEKRTQERR